LKNETWEKIEGQIIRCAEKVVCEECSVGDVRIFLNKENLKGLRKSYDSYRNRIHSQMFKNEVPMPPEDAGEIIPDYDDKIDRHKIAAALIAATIKVEPMQMRPTVREPSPRTRTANELLSYIVEVYVIKTILDTKHGYNHNITPIKCSNNESYSDHFVRVLYRIDPNQKSPYKPPLFSPTQADKPSTTTAFCTNAILCFQR